MIQGMEGRLRAIAADAGADYFGIADLMPAREAIIAQGGERLGAYHRALVVGMCMFDDLVDSLLQADRPTAVGYRHHCYDVLNSRLDLLVSRLAGELQADGHRVLPIPASKRCDDQRICALFSHKMAAHLAGLGWIGKSCLLVTPDHGPRARWASLLTSAPLAPTGSPMPPRCGDCRRCVESCPVQAFTGRSFDPQEPREARFDAAKCQSYFDHLQERDGIAVCGLCVAVCPHRSRRAPSPP
jgi:epoxyqueuosine reductase QueG